MSSRLHAPDYMGRIKVNCHDPLTIDEYAKYVRLLETKIANKEASRWVIRAVVEGGWTQAARKHCLQYVAGSVEETSWDVGANSAHFVWLAKNDAARRPTPDRQSQFVADVKKCESTHFKDDDEFVQQSASMISNAENRGWHIECNSADRVFGDGISNPREVAELLSRVFYFDPGVANSMSLGHGYADLGHYTFVLRGAAQQLLCMYILARWPWGIEGTYTIVNGDLQAPREERAHAASTLMLAANTLVSNELAPSVPIFGESNIHNLAACVSAGFLAEQPTRVESDASWRNVVWADNPINVTNKTVTSTPTYTAAKYYDYVVVKARRDCYRPTVELAQQLLR